jgi:hypothetical protein
MTALILDAVLLCMVCTDIVVTVQSMRATRRHIRYTKQLTVKLERLNEVVTGKFVSHQHVQTEHGVTSAPFTTSSN